MYNKDVKLADTTSIFELKALSRQAWHVASQPEPMGESGIQHEAQQRRHLLREFSGYWAIPVTGIHTRQMYALKALYEGKIAYARVNQGDYPDSAHLKFSDPWWIAGTAPAKGLPAPRAIVIHMTSSGGVSSYDKISFLANLGKIQALLGFGESGITPFSVYDNAGLYTYRRMPAQEGEEGWGWAIVGKDYLYGYNTEQMLEWCPTEADAETLLANMAEDGKRFSVEVRRHDRNAVYLDSKVWPFGRSGYTK